MAGLSKYGRQPQSIEPSQLISTVADHAVVGDGLVGAVFDWLACRLRCLGCHRQRAALDCFDAGVFATLE
jgi:hypothetical protein